MTGRDEDSFRDEEHLLSVKDEVDVDTKQYSSSVRRSRSRALGYSITLNAILAGLLATTWLFVAHNHKRAYIPHEIYSPARDAVKYRTQVFTGGLHGDKSPYQGFSPEVNARWEALYNTIGMSQIPASQAALLPNATTPLATDPSQYMVELDVFHQLHCLNMLRKLAYPDVFHLDLTSGSEEAEDNIYHMEHCYDQLRQSIQCHGDTATIFWEWSQTKKKMFGNLRTTHTCRDFEALQAWAREHVLKDDFDWFQEVEGAPLRIE